VRIVKLDCNIWKS